MSQGILLKEYKGLSKEKWVDIEIDEEDVYKWNLALVVVNPDSLYYGGYFKAQMTFPHDYPYKPPDFKFVRPLWHPNIYADGRLCISILHNPGEDVMSGESAGERWSPAQRVESVLISILSLLDDPEINSPANVDASVMYRDKRNEFKQRVKKEVEESKKDVPEGFIMPTHESTKPVVDAVDDDFWVDSDADGDFADFDDDDDDNILNGSESDEALNHDSEDDEEEEEGGGRGHHDGDNDDDDEGETILAREREGTFDSEMTEPDR